MRRIFIGFRCHSRQLLALMVAMALPLAAYAQSFTTVSGIVVDENSQPMIGVAVIVPGTGSGTSTDLDGHYSINVPKGAETVEFSFIGYITMQQTVRGGLLNVQMQPDMNLMEEVVVIGYGVQKKEDMTGSITSVSEKDFNQGVISSPEQLVNGKIAGVQIISGGGSPTAGSTIRVRGGASLNASNEPLIVLDGVPMEVGGKVSGNGNFLSLINPNDIESMTVLKDASSTAIYGSRASNGVIIITTKKGGSNRLKVSFQTVNSMATATKSADMLSIDEFINVVNTNGSDKQKALLGNERTDWNDLIFQNAFATDNNLSLSGRMAEWLPFRASLGVMSQDGILRTDNTRRYSANINLTPAFFDDDLRINFSAKASYNQNTFANTGAIWGGSALNPTIPVYSGSDLFGGYTEAADANGAPVTGALANAVGLLDQRQDKSDVVRVIGNADIDWKVRPVKGLRLHGTFGYDYSMGRGDVVVPAEAYQFYTTGGRNYTYGPQENHNRLVTVYANYNREFGKHAIDATAGYDYQYWRYYSSAFEEFNQAGEVQSSSAAGDQRHALLSYYGRINYTYDDRYLLTATMRRDGSSRFSEKNRWGTFPSVALAWRMSKESFFEPLTSVVNDLKLRVSYGVTGQQDGIENYGHIPVYTISQNGAQYQFGGTPIYTYRPEAYNSDLRWETTRSWNYGIDLAFLDNRITASVDYYDRKTEDLLAIVPSPAGVNFDKQMLTNVGNVDSRGLEIALSATPVSTKDWVWNISANATWQRSRITNLTLVPGADSPDTGVGPWIDSYQMQVFSTGYAPYAFYVYKQIYDEKTGRPIEGLYADLDGDGAITTDDRYHYHSPAPDWMFGLSTSLSYKKWTLSTSLRASLGNYIFNGMAMNTGAWETMSYNDYQLNNLHRSYLETGFSKRQYLSDHYMENGSFIKMDNLSLSYTFDKVFKAVDINLTAMCQNVFTITKYSGVDPENSGGVDTSVYPRPRTFSLSVGINF